MEESTKGKQSMNSKPQESVHLLFSLKALMQNIEVY